MENKQAQPETPVELDAPASARTDAISGIVVIAFSAALYSQASDFPRGASGFPIGLAAALGLSGILLVLRSIPRLGVRGEKSSYSWLLFAVAVFLWGIAVKGMPVIGFEPTALIFLFALSWAMSGFTLVYRKLAGLLLFSGLTTFVMWFVFSRVLSVSLP